MTSWSGLKDYIKSNYKVAEEQDGFLRLVFEVEDMRSQIVMIMRMTLMDGSEEWAQFASPVGPANSIDLEAALRDAGDWVCGGLAIIADKLFVVDSAPLADMNTAELIRPLMLVTATADRLERKYVGGDAY